ncbi:HNH endonuclease [Streptomyces sp. NPDC001194]|uniref:HNH endonuclease n=1 Tax=Streptomyces sp. NPDC001194 TaxID=3364547 RepID=UPI0036CFE51D
MQLVKRDGSDCRLCDTAIDLGLKFPDPFSVSIDHVLPRAKGGSDAAVNLQLAHLRCNIVKRDRLLTVS